MQNTFNQKSTNKYAQKGMCTHPDTQTGTQNPEIAPWNHCTLLSIFFLHMDVFTEKFPYSHPVHKHLCHCSQVFWNKETFKNRIN